MDDETKADPVKRLVGVLKKQEKIGTGAHYFENLLADDARLTPEDVRAYKSAADASARELSAEAQVEIWAKRIPSARNGDG